MSESQPVTRLRPWLLYALAWVPPTLLYGVAVSMQGQTTWLQALTSGVIIMGAAALVGVGVWWLSGRVPFPGRSRLLFAAIHLLGALLYAGIWVGIVLGWLYLVAGPEITRFVMQQAGIWQFSTGLYVYGLIAGVSYLVRTQKQLRERETAAARAEAAAAQAQLQNVRANLNPHFLFNALHAVGALVRSDPAAADRAIEQLGGLLRRSLDHSTRDSVPLGQEWEFVKGYLELEQLRLGDRLRLETDMDPAALDVPVPPFLLQPLVENAVRHGIAARPEGGTIHVQAARRNGALNLRISDDGPARSEAGSSAGTGFGLEGVRQQLDAHYGQRARLQVERADERGFVVSLFLPIDPERS